MSTRNYLGQRLACPPNPARVLRHLVVLEYAVTLAAGGFVALWMVTRFYASGHQGVGHSLNVSAVVFYFIIGPLLVCAAGMLAWLGVATLLKSRVRRARNEMYELMLAVHPSLEAFNVDVYVESDQGYARQDDL